MTTQQVMPTAGLEPARLSAPDPKSGVYGETHPAERTPHVGERTALTSVSTTDRTTDVPHTSRAGKRRGSSYGLAPAGYLTEAELAARWGRSPNTLVGWRTRLAKGRPPIPVDLIDGVWCYGFAVIESVEARDDYRWIRPVELRGMPLPSLRVSLEDAVKDRLAENEVYSPTVASQLTARVSAVAHCFMAEVPRHLSEFDESNQLAARVAAAAKARGVEAPQLPLSLEPETIEHAPAPRGFKSLRIEAGYALAIATDDTAYFASVLGGLQYVTWHPVASLPADDELLARLTRRAA